MVENWLTSEETAALLGVTMNNLRQIQFRGTLKWGKREGRKVFYDSREVSEYLEKRSARANKVS